MVWHPPGYLLGVTGYLINTIYNYTVPGLTRMRFSGQLRERALAKPAQRIIRGGALAGSAAGAKMCRVSVAHYYHKMAILEIGIWG